MAITAPVRIRVVRQPKVRIRVIPRMTAKNGASAYEIAVENGFVGTEEEWLASLVGEPGQSGEPGTPGEPGSPGADGLIVAIQEGSGITVDNTDPARPIVSATGGGGAVDSVNGQTGVVVLNAPDIATDSGGTFNGDDIETVLDGHEGRIVDLEGEIAGLGTAAEANVGDFATAAQGTLADSAVQPGELVINAADYGWSTGASASTNSSAFAFAMAAAGNGTVLLPAGTYSANDLTIAAKGSGASGGFKLSAQGVIISGTGKLIIDSCKRVVIEGLDAPGMSLALRGCWWLAAHKLRMKEVVYRDAAGTSFQTCYWNDFFGCMFQRVVFANTGAEACNAQNFYSCTLRGDAAQGFSGTINYNFEFNGDYDCQNINFFGGDISYANTGVYSIDPANDEEVELSFFGTYFDTKIPRPIDRSQFTLNVRDCHVANDMPNTVSISSIPHGGWSAYRSERGVGWEPYGGLNLIRNGEFRKTQASYVGANLPFGGVNGATVTAQTGAGWHGNYWNINQAATSSNSFSMRCNAAPWKGRYTGTVIIRNADIGSKTLRGTFLGLSFDLPISNAEWTVATLTTKTEVAAGTQLNLQIFTNDGTAYNVDVAYGAIVFGEAPPIYLPSQMDGVLEGSASYDPPSMGTGAGASTNVTVTGAAVGDFALCSWSNSLAAGVLMFAYVSATDTVTVRFHNESGTTQDPSSGTLRARVFQRV